MLKLECEIYNGTGWESTRLSRRIELQLKPNLAASSWKPGQLLRFAVSQPAFKNETTFSLITSFLQFRYLNFFLVGHPVVRFARQENGRKYLQSSAISKCPLSFGRLEVKGFALTVNKYFDLNVRLFLSIVYAGGGCAVPTRQQYTSKSLCQLSKKFLDGKVIITLASMRMSPSWCQNIHLSLIAMMGLS